MHLLKLKYLFSKTKTQNFTGNVLHHLVSRLDSHYEYKKKNEYVKKYKYNTTIICAPYYYKRYKSYVR